MTNLTDNSEPHAVSTAGDGSPKRTLSARHIIFFVIAAAAPLGFAVGSIPLAIGRGGIGAPLIFLIAGLFLALFAVGYVAMTRFIPNAGAFFSYISAGLGRPLGIGVAFVATMSYALICAGSIGPFAIFAEQAFASVLGFAVPWPVLALGAVLIVGILGQLNIELNFRVLGVIMVAEVAALTILGVAVVLRGGGEGLSFEAFTPDAIAGGQIGVLLLIVFAAFAGFEATALFREEAKDAVRTLRRATVGSVAIIALLQAFVAWFIVQAFGSLAVTTANESPTTMFTEAATQYVGEWLANTIAVLVAFSWFASVLAFHNATTRYLLVLGRDRVIPSMFARRSQRSNAPWFASAILSGFVLCVIVLVIVAGLDPYLDLFVLGSVPVAVSIPAMECLTSVAIVAFFLRNRRGQSIWVALIAPGISAIALAVVVYLVLTNIEFYTAQTGPINWMLPGINVVILIIGIMRAFWMKTKSPALYDAVSSASGIR